MRVMSAVVAVSLAAIGCTREPQPSAAASTATSARSVKTSQGDVDGTGASGPWHRARVAEPDPAAKGLYRRLVMLAQRGDVAGAQALQRQILRDYPESRYATRLAFEGGSPKASFALAQLATAALIPLIIMVKAR